MLWRGLSSGGRRCWWILPEFHKPGSPGVAENRLQRECAEVRIPWQDIIGTRNRLAHGYFQISLEVVWDIVQKDISQLIDLLKTLVPPEAE